MKYLLLDTNIYLHYIDFEQIDWATIINDDNFAIIVPFTVIKEIDKHKDGPKSKIKTRAKTISSKFGSYFLDENHNSKINLIPLNEPSNEILTLHNLNHAISDDVIIGSALAFEHKENVTVISHDNTLLIKAKKYGLNFIAKMPDKYLVSEEKSEEEKEYERCRKELEQLKNRQPKPHITFENDMNELRFHQTQTTDINTELNEIVTKIKNEHPHINRPSTTEELDTKGAFQLEKITQIFTTLQNSIYTDQQLKEHNKELDKFYAHCEKYYRFKLESELLEKQFQELRFNIANTGTAETGEMTITLEFPEHVKLYNKKSKRYMNDIQPKAPIIGCLFSEYNQETFNKYISPINGLNIPQIKCWDTAKYLSKQNITITTKSLIHNVYRLLNIDNSIYLDIRQCGNFSIKWHICAAGCIAPQSGTLNVITK